MANIIGQVVHHGKYGYGVTWRTDKYDRASVKFESGKEVGGLGPADVRPVDKFEFDSEKVMEKLKTVGLDAYIKMSVDEPAAQAKMEDIHETKKVFAKMHRAVKFDAENLEEAKVKALKILEESEIDDFTKEKINKRISRSTDIDKVLGFLKNSLDRYVKIEEEKSIFNLNVSLTEIIKSF
jgi:hypothetical protein